MHTTVFSKSCACCKLPLAINGAGNHREESCMFENGPFLKSTNPHMASVMRRRPMPSGAMSLKLNLQFGGGAELLFDKIKKREIDLPALTKYLPESDRENWTIRELLLWIRDNLLKERPELFLQGETVRPGILVLVNDADWELCGELDYQVQTGDTIMFISTLHGG